MSAYRFLSRSGFILMCIVENTVNVQLQQEHKKMKNRENKQHLHLYKNIQILRTVIL